MDLKDLDRTEQLHFTVWEVSKRSSRKLVIKGQ